MKIILHIGTHRTGTTSLQKFCTLHRKTLKKRGFLYPDCMPFWRRHHAHHHVAFALAESSKAQLSDSQARKFIRGVIVAASDYDHILISSESFYRHTYPETDRTRPYWERRRAFVQRVREAFGTADVSVVVTLRRQDDFAQSLYNELIKERRVRQDFPGFLRSWRHFFQYSKQLRLWEEYFGPIRAFVFGDLTKDGGDVTLPLLKRMGGPVEGLRALEVQNVSLPLELLDYKRELNRAEFSSAQHKKLSRELFSSRVLGNLDLPTTKKVWAPTEDFQRFQSQFSEGNRWVLKHCTDLKRTELFGKSLPPQGQLYSGMPPQVFRRITKEMCRERQIAKLYCLSAFDPGVHEPTHSIGVEDS